MTLLPMDLRFNGLTDPFGVDVEASRVRLGWTLEGEGRNRSQLAYQVQVAADRDCLLRDDLLWDSHRVASDQSQHVPYLGPRPESRESRAWRVRVWDETDCVGSWSDAATWEIGLLNESDWDARWISMSPHDSERDPIGPSPLLRREFHVAEPGRRARLYICGLGFHEVQINGRRVGDHVLDPAYTAYDRRALYVTHDITRHVVAGPNVIGVMLGNGMYNYSSVDIWDNAAAAWRDRPKMLVRIEIEQADGTLVVLSDRHWRAHTGPLVVDAVRGGETHDARLEPSGWSETGFDDRAWSPAFVVPGPGGRVVAQTLPVRVVDTLHPAGIRESGAGTFVVDFGRNITGRVRLRATGPRGSVVTLRHSEKLTDAGDIDQSNIDGYIEGECQTDRYILHGRGPEEWEARFTYHGFQFVEVSGYPGPLTAGSLDARVLRTDFASVGEFRCSDEIVNRINTATRNSYESNFVGAPLDCPHREKNSWLGDQTAETGLLNYDVAPAYAKWLDDVADVQRPNGQLPAIAPTSGWGYNNGSGPAWDSTYLALPWTLYLYTGDRAVLERHYLGMRRYMDFLDTMHDGHILSFGLGDWCPPGNFEGWDCPVEITSTACWYADARLMTRVAQILDRTQDEQRFDALATRIKTAFNTSFYDVGLGRYQGDEMTAQACALYEGLVEETEEPRVLASLLTMISEADEHLGVGMLGARYLMNALTEHGASEIALRIATQPSYPGWGHWMERGATTLWETWDGSGSRNHIMFGDISAWFMKTLAGIRPDPTSPGFRRVLISPALVSKLTWVEGSYGSPHGPIRSGWRREGREVRVDLHLPPNTTARVTLPLAPDQEITESGRALGDAEGVTQLERLGEDVILGLGSGDFTFRLKPFPAL